MNQASGWFSQGRHQSQRSDGLRREEFGLDELYAPEPDQDIDQGSALESKQTRSTGQQDNQSALSREESGLNELYAPPPDENPREGEIYRHSDLERQNDVIPEQQDEIAFEATQTKLSLFLTQLYIFSYLIWFSILGVLARIGLQALTLYPGALVPNTDLWANFGGCLVIGFLREDRMLFRRDWQRAQREHDKNGGSSEDTRAPSTDRDLQDADNVKDAVNTAFRTSRAQIPGYIGLTVGFCGSFTSFASISRDAFLAISNNINTDATADHFVTSSARSRDAGYSVMAVLAVCLLEIGLSVVALQMGSHLAIMTERLLEDTSLNLSFSKILDPLIVLLAWLTWIGAVILTIFGPYDSWRGKVLFALVFAPVGCILRFQLSVRMNRLVSSFPLGTFAANVFGSAILGMSYDLQHSSAARSVVGCQVLQGIEDGFCGALTTVSTWVLELETLRLHHKYIYGGCSIFIATGCITAIMGSLYWTNGLMTPTCSA